MCANLNIQLRYSKYESESNEVTATTGCPSQGREAVVTVSL
jgi:hypothetical protein